MVLVIKVWLRGIDSNYRPSGYEPDELPTAPPRDVFNFLTFISILLFLSIVNIYLEKSLISQIFLFNINHLF